MVAGSSHDPALLTDADSSHDREGDSGKTDQKLRVPLLSQEGPTCRFLPGATAPFPALDQELTKFPAPAGSLVKFLSAPTRNLVCYCYCS